MGSTRGLRDARAIGPTWGLRGVKTMGPNQLGVYAVQGHWDLLGVYVV